MPEMNEYTPELYELTDEDGNVKKFELIDVIEVDESEYFAMVSAFEGEEEAEDLLNDDGELVILKSEEHEGEEILCSIEDDDEYTKIAEIFLKRLEDGFMEFNCDDDCDCGDDCDCDETAE